MEKGQRAPAVAGLAAVALLHTIAAVALLAADTRQMVPQSADGNGILLLLPAPAAAAAASGRAAAGPGAPSAMPATRPELRYYLPEELEREPIVLRDSSGDADIKLPASVVLQLFVDAGGKVVRVTVEGAPLAPALERQLRAVFGSIEFLPGVKGGKPVPARLRIELSPGPGPAAAG